MKRVNRDNWQESIAFEAFGVEVKVRTNNSQIFDKLDEFLPPTAVLLEESKPVDEVISIVWDKRKKRVTKIFRNDEENICYSENDWQRQFESLLRLAISEFSPHFVFLHSGAVAYNNLAIVLPGKSYAGKTTLTAALVRAGADYYSDEFAVIDQHGFLHPYAKTLSVREEMRQVNVPVENIGGRQATKPLPIGLVVMTEYKDSARSSFKSLSNGEGVLRMVENAMSARTNPQMVFRVLSKVVQNAVVLKGKRGDAALTAEKILSYLTHKAQLAA